MSYSELLSALFANPFRAVSIILLVTGVISTCLCFRKRHEPPRHIREDLLIKSAERTIETMSGEPANPTRMISFGVRGKGRVVGTVESLDGTSVKLSVRRQYLRAQDLVVPESSANLIKGPFDFSSLRAGDYQITVEGSDRNIHKARIDFTITDETTPYEKYLPLAVAILTSGVVVLIRSL